MEQPMRPLSERGVKFARRAGCALAVVAAIAMWPAPGVTADDAAEIEKALPRTYAGEFRWAGETIPQKVEIRINVISSPAAGRIEAIGCGRYDALGRVTDIGVRMVIDVPSLDIEIWEFSPFGPVARAFVTEGSHRGRLFNKLQAIDAEWTSRADGRKGRLQLRATATPVEFKCSAEQAAVAPHLASRHMPGSVRADERPALYPFVSAR